MSEFGKGLGEGGNDFYVPDLGGMDFGKILNEDAYDGGTAYEFADFDMLEGQKEELIIEMQGNPYRRFERAYKQQDIELNPKFKEKLLGVGVASVGHCFSNDELEINKTVALAGRMLRENPDEKLAKRPIKLPSDHDIPLCETSMKTLETMINSSIERPPVEQLPKHQFKSSGIQAIDMCSKAEGLFNKAVPKKSKLKIPSVSEKLNYQAIADETDDGWEILGVRKWEGVPSVITFKDVAVDGVEYPAGSIMRFELESDGSPERGKYTEYINTNPPRVVSSDKVVRAGFLRLANGFAGEPQNIGKLVERVKYDLHRLEAN